MKKQLNVICHLDPNISFGYLSRIYIHGLLDAGWKVNVATLDKWDVKNPDPRCARNVRQLVASWPTLNIHPMNTDIGKNLHDEDILLSVWETSSIPKVWIDHINRASMLIIPTKWHVDVYRKSGFKKPIHIAPYGVDPTIFNVQDTFPAGAIFMTAGRTGHGRYRKGLERVIMAFLMALPSEKDAVLWVKSQPGCDVLDIKHPRVQIIEHFLHERDLASFYQKGFCYVNGSTGEGWGLHQQQALMCGRPMISTTWGGVGTFFCGDKHGIEVPYKLEKVTDYFYVSGSWAVPSIEDLAKAIRYAYDHRIDMFMRGMQASMDVSGFTTTRMQQSLLELLEAKL